MLEWHGFANLNALNAPKPKKRLVAKMVQELGSHPQTKSSSNRTAEVVDEIGAWVYLKCKVYR